MTMMDDTPYFTKVITLNAIIAKGDKAGQLSPPGMAVTDVGVLTLPAGAVGAIFLHLGQKGDPIRLNLQGQNFHLAQPTKTGVWVTVPAAVGAVDVEFLIGLDATLEQRF